MQTIHAIWKDGVFTPDSPVNLVEGIEVEIQVVPAARVTESKRSSQSYPLPDPPFESECQPPPFELPMPSPGRKVVARKKGELLPDPHDLDD